MGTTGSYHQIRDVAEAGFTEVPQQTVGAYLESTRFPNEVFVRAYQLSGAAEQFDRFSAMLRMIGIGKGKGIGIGIGSGIGTTESDTGARPETKSGSVKQSRDNSLGGCRADADLHPGTSRSNQSSSPMAIALSSFPNSGTSWLLNLVRHATGVFKHTVYKHECCPRPTSASATPTANGSATGSGIRCVESMKLSATTLPLHNANADGNGSGSGNGNHHNNSKVFVSDSLSVYAINETADRNGAGRLPLPGEAVLVKTHVVRYGKPENDKLSPNAHVAKVMRHVGAFQGIVHLIRNPIDNIASRVQRALQLQLRFQPSTADARASAGARNWIDDNTLRRELHTWASWHLALAEAVLKMPQLAKRHHVLTYVSCRVVSCRVYVAVLVCCLNQPDTGIRIPCGGTVVTPPPTTTLKAHKSKASSFISSFFLLS